MKEKQESETSALNKLRLDKALPVLNELGKLMVETYKTALQKSAMGKATAYYIPGGTT